MKKGGVWYFDVISPFAYLQSRRLEQLGETVDLRPVPVLFAGLLKHWGQLGPAEIAPKRQFIFRQVAWRAQRDGIPFCMPPNHPFNPLWGLRLIAAQGNSFAATHAVFQHIWADGRSLSTDEDREALAQRVGLTLAQADEATQQTAIKQAIIDNSDSAIAAGVYGVPTVKIDDQCFWGDDSLAMLEDWLSGDLDFESEIMRSIDSTRPSAVRQRKT